MLRGMTEMAPIRTSVNFGVAGSKMVTTSMAVIKGTLLPTASIYSTGMTTVTQTAHVNAFLRTEQDNSAWESENGAWVIREWSLGSRDGHRDGRRWKEEIRTRLTDDVDG